MIELVSLPAATTTLTNIAAWSAPFFESFLPTVYISVGVLVGSYLVLFVYGAVVRGIHHFTDGIHTTHMLSAPAPSGNAFLNSPAYRYYTQQQYNRHAGSDSDQSGSYL